MFKLNIRCLAWLLLVGCSQSDNFTSRSAGVRLQLGLNYLMVNRYAEAKRNLDLAYLATPKDYRVILAMARLYQQLGETLTAHRCYRKALQLVPKNGDFLNNYGAFLCSLGQYEKAQKQFEAAQQAEQLTARTEARLQSGYCYLVSGQSELAWQQWNMVKRRDPQLANRILSVLQNYYQQGRWASASLLGQFFLQHFGATAESLWLMILIAAQQGNTSAIVDYGEMLAHFFPHSIQYQRYIAHEY